MTHGVLIVGLGRIGMEYDFGQDPAVYATTHGRAFSTHPAFHLLGGVEPDRQRRRRFEHAYRSPAFETVESALSIMRPDIVVISAPTALHWPILRAILAQSQVRAVLCEKPLSHKLQEAQAMVQACAARGALLYVNYVRRADPGAIEVKRRFEDGRIATPAKGVAWYSKGLLHNGSHFFNLMEFWLGELADAQIISAGRLWDGADPEPDFHATFRRGSVVFLAAQEENFSHYTAELVTPNGRLRYENGGERIEWQQAAADATFEGYKSLAADSEALESGVKRYQWHVADQLASALDGKYTELCDGAAALLTLENLTTLVAKRCP